jgi:hypothetical protein
MSFEEMQSILQGVLLSQQQFQSEIVEMKALANSNSRAIQAMLDQAATDRLENQERARRHEEGMGELRDISRGLVNLAVSIAPLAPSVIDVNRPLFFAC